MRAAMFACVLLAVSGSALAAGEQTKDAAPKTKLEAFSGETGVVVIKGYTEIGTVVEQGKISIEAMTFRNAQSGQQSQGILIEVHGGGTYDHENRSFVDYDEIKGLLDGLKYVSKADSSVTKLRFFEATYSTKGDLKVTVFNNAAGQKSAAVQSGTIGGSTVYISLDKLDKLAALIASAKDTLDSTR